MQILLFDTPDEYFVHHWVFLTIQMKRTIKQETGSQLWPGALALAKKAGGLNTPLFGHKNKGNQDFKTGILKLSTKHLKQKSENRNRNRTFQMRTAQLVGWTLDTGQSPDWLFTRAVRRGRESSENFQRFWDNFQKYSTFSWNRSIGNNAFLFFKISETYKSQSLAQSLWFYRSEKNPSFVADLIPPNNSSIR